MVTAKQIEVILLNSSIKLESHSFDSEIPLTEQGVDSMDIVVLLMEVEDHFGLKASPGDIDAFRSLKSIADFVNAAQSGKPNNKMAGL